MKGRDGHPITPERKLPSWNSGACPMGNKGGSCVATLSEEALQSSWQGLSHRGINDTLCASTCVRCTGSSRTILTYAHMTDSPLLPVWVLLPMRVVIRLSQRTDRRKLRSSNEPVETLDSSMCLHYRDGEVICTICCCVQSGVQSAGQTKRSPSDVGAMISYTIMRR